VIQAKKTISKLIRVRLPSCLEQTVKLQTYQRTDMKTLRAKPAELQGLPPRVVME
jgi:hypothetical protein